MPTPETSAENQLIIDPDVAHTRFPAKACLDIYNNREGSIESLTNNAFKYLNPSDIILSAAAHMRYIWDPSLYHGRKKGIVFVP